MTAKEIFVIRHGETDLNLQGIVQGRGVNPPLNETGKRQAQLFFRRYERENFEIIYTSTLLRAHQSVAYFIDKGITWEQHAELDEINWGIYEGKRANHDFREQYRQMINDWKEGRMDVKSPLGESPNDVRERQERFIRYMQQKPQKKVLICMHGRALRIFLPTLLQQDLRYMDAYPHHNLTLYKLIFDGVRFTISLFNNMDHLHEEG